METVVKETETKVEKQVRSVIYLLPSEATHTFVQIKPSLKISSVMPARERKVLVDDNGSYKPTDHPYECCLPTPTLMLTQILLWWSRPHSTELATNGMCKCFSCNFDSALVRGYRRYNKSQSKGNPYYYQWHAIDLEKSTEDTLRTRPYAVANTDGTYICWGNNEYPPSLRIANCVYWMSRLNNSPGKFAYSRGNDQETANKNLAEKMIEYSKGFLSGGGSWGNGKTDILGAEFIATSLPAEGVFLSFDNDLIEEYSDAAIDNGKENSLKALIGFANKDEHGAWVIDTAAGPIHMNDELVKVL